MRLLNSSTLALEEFFDDHTPKYAILSHRWLDDEVSLQDMLNGKASKKAGYAKLKLCCDQAVKDGLQYAWVDTCCIDKTSSAELTEAINSMYRWYQNATVCYAYISDVQDNDPLIDPTFRGSMWFTRGWTLQELIAPACVEFYNKTWKKLGTKESLREVISDITNIDVEMLLAGADPEAFSIAKRMSWASKRTTTRSEDRAYSLLGLFGVNMPMLYGEGARAFIRLQEEIMKSSDDQSLFAWTSNSDNYRGLLAQSPGDFADCHNVVSSKSKWNRRPYSVTNMGLSVQMPMVAWAMETYLAALDCEIENVPNSRIGIFLQLQPEDKQYARVRLQGQDTQTFKSELAAKSQYREIFIRQKGHPPRPITDRLYGFWIRKLPKTTATDAKLGTLSDVDCWNKWSDEDRILEIPRGSSGTAGCLRYRSNSFTETLKLGFDLDFNPICQFGGHLYSPVKPPVDPQSREAKMHPSWMDIGRSDYLHMGNRRTGYYQDSHPHRISITDEEVGGKRMWVLDILNLDDPANGIRQEYVCDGCGLVSDCPFVFPSSALGILLTEQ